MRRVLSVLVLVAACAVVPAAAVGPVSPAPAVPVPGVLSAAHPVLAWGGQMHNPAPVPMASDPDPTVCAVDCELWSLRVATAKPFLVSIHNGSDSLDDGFDLAVYDPAGTEVASSSGIGSNGQAAVVHPTGPGVYTVAVTMTYAYDAAASYLAEARVMAGASWSRPECETEAPCPVLPVLRALPPSDVHVDGVPPVASTPLGFPFPVDAPTGFSCYLDETATTGASRCLRFTSEVDNVGLGVLTLQIPWAAASSGQSGFVPGLCEAQQVVTYTDGSTRTRPAGACEFHPTHGHFHYRDYVEFSLRSVNADGSVGPQVATSLKESFCLADDGYFGFGTAGPNGPRHYVGQPDCNVPGTPSTSDVFVTMGNSPGWGDIYTWDTPDQYIDISTVPDGVYDIESRANPAGALLLGAGSQPCGATRIRLTASAVTVLASGVPCG